MGTDADVVGGRTGRALAEISRRYSALMTLLRTLPAEQAAELAPDSRTRMELAHGQDDIDLTGIRFDDPATLNALDALVDSARADHFAVRGLGWHQFLGLLRRLPLDELQEACDHIRAILATSQRSWTTP